MRSRTWDTKPFITDSTTIRAITPSAMPRHRDAGNEGDEAVAPAGTAARARVAQADAKFVGKVQGVAAKGETIVRKRLSAPSKRSARVDPALRIAEMQLTVMLTGSQLAADIAAPLVSRLDAPTLKRMLERGRKSDESISPRGTAAEDWLARHVFADGPTAPYAWADLTGQCETVQTIWHADPIHLSIGRESVIIGSLAEDPLSDAEADALIAAANESFGDRSPAKPRRTALVPARARGVAPGAAAAHRRRRQAAS